MDVYSSELYPHSMPLSPWENIMRVAGELGIVCYGKDGSELVTRDEAEDLLKQLAATDIELVAPPIASQISIENKDWRPAQPVPPGAPQNSRADFGTVPAAWMENHVGSGLSDAAWAGPRYELHWRNSVSWEKHLHIRS